MAREGLTDSRRAGGRARIAALLRGSSDRSFNIHTVSQRGMKMTAGASSWLSDSVAVPRSWKEIQQCKQRNNHLPPGAGPRASRGGAPSHPAHRDARRPTAIAIADLRIALRLSTA